MIYRSTSRSIGGKPRGLRRWRDEQVAHHLHEGSVGLDGDAHVTEERHEVLLRHGRLRREVDAPQPREHRLQPPRTRPVMGVVRVEGYRVEQQAEVRERDGRVVVLLGSLHERLHSTERTAARILAPSGEGRAAERIHQHGNTDTSRFQLRCRRRASERLGVSLRRFHADGDEGAPHLGHRDDPVAVGILRTQREAQRPQAPPERLAQDVAAQNGRAGKGCGARRREFRLLRLQLLASRRHRRACRGRASAVGARCWAA
mmetsp:Transcript_31774/g.98314  ORF Transcript_31774/g.98314 Transcript_31774/m.98314 type:complete len:259 (+) Transcript_31774:3-779(+)